MKNNWKYYETGGKDHANRIHPITPRLYFASGKYTDHKEKESADSK